ncbi:MAG: family 31 glucosidase [Clostridia bacterium]|nr:family 31 glucosidase [Clostridia bacterium]
MLYEKDGALWRFFNNEIIKIEPWGKNGIRVRCSPEGRISNKMGALLEAKAPVAQIKIDGDSAELVNGRAKCCIDKNGKISFYNQKGELLLDEALRLQPLKRPARAFTPRLMGKYELTLSFESNPEEKIFGMGQYQQEFLNLKGCTLEMAHRNSQASVPFYVSSLGYGFLWNIPTIGEVSFSRNITQFKAISCDELDYLVIAGDTPAEIVEEYMDATGKPPHMPELAMGFWQSKLRYRNQEELLSIARRYKEIGVPLSVIVCDFFHWPCQGDFRFDYDYWPEPEKMTKELKEMGTELMVSVWPTIEFGSENYKEMLEKGYLIRNDRGPSNHTEFVHSAVFYDTTNPDARKFVWEKAKQNYYDKGIRLFWLDEAEPEFMLYDYDNHRYYEGNCAEIGNIYPLRYAQGFYEGLKEIGEKEIITLVRCAWAGSQRYGALVWSGDIMPTYEALRCQIRAGLNMAMAGIPWWTTDIGGFDSGDPTDPVCRELTVRWFEYATFCPVLRLHGYQMPYIPAEEGAKGGGQCYTGGDNEIWSYGDEAYEIFKRLIFLRERIKPYIKEAMDRAHKVGTPPMRPLFYDFSADKRAWEIEDEYIFGSSLLVAPISYQGATQREVYLPEGCDWICVRDGEKHKGGSTLTVDAGLDEIPLFVRADSDIDFKMFQY